MKTSELIKKLQEKLDAGATEVNIAFDIIPIFEEAGDIILEATEEEPLLEKPDIRGAFGLETDTKEYKS